MSSAARLGGPDEYTSLACEGPCLGRGPRAALPPTLPSRHCCRRERVRTNAASCAGVSTCGDAEGLDQREEGTGIGRVLGAGPHLLPVDRLTERPRDLQ